MKKKFEISLVFAVLFAVLESWREGASFIVNEYRAASDKLSGLKNEIRLVQLSDLHDNRYGKNNVRLLQAIAKEDPDLILLTGDMVTASRYFNHTPTKEFLCRLAKKYPICYGLGNHEVRLAGNPDRYAFSFDRFRRTLEQAGIRVLDNDSEVFTIRGQKLVVSGLTLPSAVYDRTLCPSRLTALDIEERLGSASSDGYQILLAHSPTEESAYAAWGADLTLSGHLHGGVMRLFDRIGFVTPQLRFFYPKAHGLFRIGQGKLLVNSGLGVHKIPFRIMNSPEIAVIRLRAGKGSGC